MRDSNQRSIRQPPARAKETSSRERGAREATMIVLGVVLAVGLLVVAFGLPAVEGGPNDVPLAVTGPPPAIAQIRQGLDAAVPGGFDLHEEADEAAVRDAILRREAYGGIVATHDGPKVLTATAASPAVAQLLSGVAAAMGAERGTRVAVEDLAPLPADDPRGLGIAILGLPLVLGTLLPVILLTQLVPHRPGLHLGAIAAYVLLAGITVTTILRFWLGTLDGSFWAAAGVLALGMGSVALALLGLHAVLGRAGLGLGAATMLLLANPLSALGSAPELLPAGWGAFGQILPIGATGTLLRSAAFFDGSGGGAAALVLACWIIAGLGLAAFGAWRTTRAGTAAQPASDASGVAGGRP